MAPFPCGEPGSAAREPAFFSNGHLCLDALPTVRPQWKPILRAAARKHAVPVAALIGKSRAAPVVEARRSAYVDLRAAGYSLNEIGRFVGRDHSTVLHALAGAREVAA